MVACAKFVPKMVNPRDLAGNADEKEEHDGTWQLQLLEVILPLSVIIISGGGSLVGAISIIIIFTCFLVEESCCAGFSSTIVLCSVHSHFCRGVFLFICIVYSTVVGHWGLFSFFWIM